jgi:ATP-dependent DNA ligase
MSRSDGEDLRALPLAERKKRLARLVGKRRLGIVLSAHTDEDGELAAMDETTCQS